jgi:hypothetical protein
MSGAPSITVRDLLQPLAPVSEHTSALVARMTNGGVRDGLVRVVHSSSRQSFVPLVTMYAGIAGWRKHLSSYPGLQALNAELKEV